MRIIEPVEVEIVSAGDLGMGDSSSYYSMLIIDGSRWNYELPYMLAVLSGRSW